jgi:hypothetical protein
MSIGVFFLLAAGVANMNVTIDSKESPATESQVSALERKLQATLPADYRAFLTTKNGGRPKCEETRFGDVVFPVQWQGQAWAPAMAEALLHGFYSLNDKSPLAWKSAEEGFLTQRRVPRDLIPIGLDRGSNQVLLGISGERRGKVFFWAKDHEPVDDYEEPTYENVGFVANSFAEFLEKLRPMR